MNFARLCAMFGAAAMLFSGIAAEAGRPGGYTRSTVYSNTESITINTTVTTTAPTVATPYPSNIDVSGMTGSITRVAVTLDGLTHVRSSEVDFLLVSPTGAKFIFLSDPGPFVAPIEDGLYTFSDDAAALFPNGGAFPTSGNFRPTSGDTGTDIFPVPAPAGPYNLPPASTFASVYNGADPNGTWSLYVADDTLTQSGSIHSGWKLTITTDGAPQTFVNNSYIAVNDVLAPSTPYGTVISVAGETGVISELKVTITGLSHERPNDIDILLVSPNGKGVVIMSDAGGVAAASNVDLTLDDAAPNTITAPLVSGTYRPTDSSSESLDTFPAPAPLRPYHMFTSQNALSNFDGYSPNGEWRLYVVDDSANMSGSIAGGWSLDITTVPVQPPTPPSCSIPVFVPENYQAGANPTNLVVADLNNDGKPDAAVTNQISNDISIFLNNGSGGFLPQTLVASGGSGPYSIAAGLFNADANVDLAVANSTTNNVSVFLGNGNGTFSPPTNFFVGASPISIAAGDLNDDGKTDLAVANFGGFFSGSVSILYGTGIGTFTSGGIIRTRTQPAFVAIADINSDSHRDVLVANFGANSVTTYIGDGMGAFQLLQNINTIGNGPVAIELGDFAFVDGNPDIAIANYNSDSVTVCSGGPTGIFGSCSTQAVFGANPISVTSGDFLGSGTPLIATALSGSNTIRVLNTNVASGSNPNAVDSADFNGDGRPDLIAVNAGSNDVSVLLNSCLAAGGNLFDFNGDRRTDFSTFRPSTGGWFIQSLNQSGAVKTFARPTDILVPADYTGDRQADFAIYRPENGLWWVQDTNQRPVYFLQFGLAEDIPVPADFDGDGKADLAVWRPSQGTWYIRHSVGNSLEIFQFGTAGDVPVAVDFDGDRIDDIGVFRPSTGVWYIRRSTDGGFTIVQFGLDGDKATPADYDGDGKADISVFRPSTGVWYILRSTDGGFSATAWGISTDVPLRGDFEGDGRYDLAIWRPSDRVWYILKSSDGAPLYFQWGAPGDVPLPSVYIR